MKYYSPKEYYVVIREIIVETATKRRQSTRGYNLGLKLELPAPYWNSILP